jgi:hypothetical protein
MDLELVPAPVSPKPAKSKDAETAPDPRQVKVGDTLLLKLQGVGGLAGVGDSAKGLKLEVPPGSESLTDQGWDLDTESVGAVPDGEIRLKVTPLKSGHMTLPSLAIKDSAGKAIARTNPFTIDAQSVIKADDPKPEQPADLQPPVSLHFPWWVIALCVLVLAGLLAGGIYAYRRARGRKKKPKPAAPAEPPKPEDEVALAALEELIRSGPLKRGEFKSHYFRLSEIIKIYIGARYRFDAAESTTREMITHLEEKRFLVDAQIDRLETLFDKLDLVKFTDHVPLPDEGMRLLGQARDLILETRRPPQVTLQAGVSAGTGAGVSR